MLDAKKVYIQKILKQCPYITEESIMGLARTSPGRYVVPLVMMLNNALNLKLTINQILYLFTRDRIVFERREGLTLAYCIRLALDDEPLETFINFNTPDGRGIKKNAIYVKRMELYADYPYTVDYARNWFKDEFLRIHKTLSYHKFAVRDIRGLYS